MRTSTEWMKDPAPLSDWVTEYQFRLKLHMNTQDLEEMPYEQFIFFIGLLEAQALEEEKQIEDAKRKQK